MRDSLADPAADLHVALASVARAIAESLEITEVWDRVATACRTIAPFDAMSLQAGGAYYMEAPQGAPQWGARLTVTFLYPKR